MALPNDQETISASVGHAPSANKSADVLKVQRLLNKADAGVKEDGGCGPETVRAIKDYQRNFLTRPDGRVDPGGLTWQHLVEGKLKVKREMLTLLPQLSGLGHYSYAPAMRQYGTQACIQTVRDIGLQFHHNNATLAIGIGDISFAQGGMMSPHQTHQQGRHVDIRPLRKDKLRSPVSIADTTYSREFTSLLVENLLAHRNVKAILFNDATIRGVQNFPGHNNHLHVTMKE